MAGRKQSRGHCAYCDREMARGGLSKHLRTCPKRQAMIAAANRKRGRDEPIYHLQVQDACQGDFWLHLEMSGSARLRDLDDYLRDIWLECCGHLSQFSVGGWSGSSQPTASCRRRVKRVIARKQKFM